MSLLEKIGKAGCQSVYKVKILSPDRFGAGLKILKTGNVHVLNGDFFPRFSEWEAHMAAGRLCIRISLDAL